MCGKELRRSSFPHIVTAQVVHGSTYRHVGLVVAALLPSLARQLHPGPILERLLSVRQVGTASSVVDDISQAKVAGPTDVSSHARKPTSVGTLLGLRGNIVHRPQDAPVLSLKEAAPSNAVSRMVFCC